MKVENHKLSATKITSSSNILFDGWGQTMISPWFTWDTGNEYKVIDGIGPDDVLEANTDTSVIQIGDLYIVSTHSDGVVIYRITDGPNLTYVTKFSPNNSYWYHWDFAYHEDTQILWCGAYPVAGIYGWDLSGVLAGGSTVTQVYSVQKGVINTDTVGYAHIGGIVLAGDWLYYSGDDSDIPDQGRYNVVTHTNENLTVINRDEYMDKGRVVYDALTDRVYTFGFYNGQVWCTTDASSSTSAKTYQIRYEQLTDIWGGGISNDFYERGFAIDKNNRNYIYVGPSSRRLAKIDITNAINPTSPVRDCPYAPDWNSSKTRHWHSWGHSAYWRYGASATHGSDLIEFYASDGWYEKGGWVDQETGIVLTRPDRLTANSTSEYYQSNDYLEYNYSQAPFDLVTPNGTHYWFQNGYDYDGYRFYVYEYNKPKELHSSGFIEFGGYQLSGSENISMINIPGLFDMVHIPTGTSLSILVSNNNGATWEVMDSDHHDFISTGNNVKLKISFTGNGKTTSYIWGYDHLHISLVEGTTAIEEEVNVKHAFKKLRAFKIRGGR